MESIDLFHKQMRGVDSGVLAKALTKRDDMLTQVHNIIAEGTPKELDEMIKNNAMSRKDVQGYIFSDLLSGVADFSQGTRQIRPEAFVAHVEKLKTGKFWKYLNSTQKDILSKEENISSFLKDAADAGVSLAAANLTAAQTRFLQPGSAISAKLQAIQIHLVGKLTTNDTLIKVMVGGQKPTNIKKTRAAILGVTQALHSFMQDEAIGNLRE